MSSKLSFVLEREIAYEIDLSVLQRENPELWTSFKQEADDYNEEPNIRDFVTEVLGAWGTSSDYRGPTNTPGVTITSVTDYVDSYNQLNRMSK